MEEVNDTKELFGLDDWYVSIDRLLVNVVDKNFVYFKMYDFCCDWFLIFIIIIYIFTQQ